MASSSKTVWNRHKCWLTAVLFIFKTVGINFNLSELLILENEDIIKEVKDKSRGMFEEMFFNEIRNSSPLQIHKGLKKKSRLKYTLMKSNITSIGLPLLNFGSRQTPRQSERDDGCPYTEIREYALYE